MSATVGAGAPGESKASKKMASDRHLDDSTTQITVVIVTYNSADVIADLLLSLPDGFEGANCAETIIVDNASQDETLSMVVDLAPEATLIRMPRNAGYAAAINRAIHRARPSDAVLVLNADVRLRAGAVHHLVQALADNQVGVAVPRLVDESGTTSHSLRRRPTVGRAFGEAVLGGRLAGRFSPLGEVITDSGPYETAGAVDWASGAVWLVSRRCLEAVGDWDESFFLYCEETDFALRAHDAGFKVWYVPDAIVEHIGGDAHHAPDLWALLTVNRVRLFWMLHRLVANAAYLAAIVLGTGARAALGRRTDRRALAALVRWVRHREPPMEAGLVESSRELGQSPQVRG